MSSTFNTVDLNEIFRKLNTRSWHAATFARAYEFGFACAYCSTRFYGSYEEYLQWSEDHVIPTSKGGSDEIANRVPCCKICNSIKAGWDPREEIGHDRPVEEYIVAAKLKFGDLKKIREQEFEAHRRILLGEGVIDLG